MPSMSCMVRRRMIAPGDSDRMSACWFGKYFESKLRCLGITYDTIIREHRNKNIAYVQYSRCEHIPTECTSYTRHH